MSTTAKQRDNANAATKPDRTTTNKVTGRQSDEGKKGKQRKEGGANEKRPKRYQMMSLGPLASFFFLLISLFCY
jgi:hypothetical protein